MHLDEKAQFPTLAAAAAAAEEPVANDEEGSSDDDEERGCDGDATQPSLQHVTTAPLQAILSETLRKTRYGYAYTWTQ